ncbi:MAG: low molecular weight protein arginine phosphatase [Clostridia bacterium]|nr:low molecular weight protein arginine phosphatase [Clostridia bacterium]
MKIMFICTGNICRSAMAHKLMQKKLKDNEVKDIDVYSCGIFAENGDASTYNAIEVTKEYGVDLKSHKATNIRDSKIDEMDLILCATMSHKYSVIQMYPSLANKIYTLKEYVDENKDLDIKDPWGYDIEIYRFCIAEIDRLLDKLIEKIK